LFIKLFCFNVTFITLVIWNGFWKYFRLQHMEIMVSDGSLPHVQYFVTCLTAENRGLWIWTWICSHIASSVMKIKLDCMISGLYGVTALMILCYGLGFCYARKKKFIYILIQLGTHAYYNVNIWKCIVLPSFL
jgi:hypothetical protein